MNHRKANAIAVTVLAVSCFGFNGTATAHCDSLDGPVVRDARAALEKGDPSTVLKWVSGDRENEIRDAFARTLAVRRLSDSARQVADQYFFETLVRVHRAGEGEGFTGLKPRGSIDPAIAAADAALGSGSRTDLTRELSAAVEAGIRKRFDLVLARRKQSDASIEAGRAYVAAYVDYVHFVESLQHLAEHGAPHTHREEQPGDLKPRP